MSHQSLMHPICEFLQWDSDFFSLRIGKAIPNRVDLDTMSQIKNWCKNESIDCLYFLSDADDPVTTHLLLHHQFDLVDTRMTLERDLIILPPFEPSTTLRLAHEEDIPQLKQIAKHSYHHTRYYFDGRFPVERCDDLYATWIERSCQGYADAVWVATEDSGAVQGFITCSIHEMQGEIGLLGVASGYSGRGIGFQLVMRALSWIQEKGVKSVKVVTQGRNIPAQRLYQRTGFLSHSLRHWYHYWQVK